MNPLRLELPDDAKVIGELYNTKQRAFLTEDIMQVILPNDIHVDVGWYPEHDPSGEFEITVFHRSWDNLLEQKLTKNVIEVKQWVELLAAYYLIAWIDSQSSDQRIELHGQPGTYFAMRNTETTDGVFALSLSNPHAETGLHPMRRIRVG